MTFPGVKRRPPFVTLPRHKRSHEVIRLKGEMRRDATEYPKGLKPELALKQQSFIQLLRNETHRDNDALGVTQSSCGPSASVHAKPMRH